MENKFNELVSFLIGKWDNVTFEITDSEVVKKEEYPETMVGKSEHVIAITAHGFRDGKDITKDMNLELIDDKIVMSQGLFKAEGYREVWNDGLIQNMNMSYLVRK